MNETRKLYQLILLLTLANMGCNTNSARLDGFHFSQLDAAQTNIRFSNTITESDSINVFTNEYMYNGSGVGIGDFNMDGLPDLFFCGSMVSSKLYINKGDFKFEDITDKAGVGTNRWCTGVSIVDINNDGFPDIYVSASHSDDAAKRQNQLFINDGKLNFTDQAAAYGLADTGYATQAAFLDYDQDGDLDMYLLNHRLYSHTANNIQPMDSSGNSPAQDRLYQNQGVPVGKSHPVFEDVSSRAGINEDGYGLGLVITDVNGDHYPDIYIANDYISNDALWMNNKNGTFSNVISTATRHQSYNSMGVDAADINNDGLPDLAVTDMLPENNERKKMMSASTNQEKFDMQQRFGYAPSYVRNMLQLNNGTRMNNGKPEPFYSEIGQLAGIFETDWSWSILMADFDNDGWKDIHITNGLAKDVTNNDYNAFNNGKAHSSSYTFGDKRSADPLDKKTIQSLRKNIDAYGSVPMINYLFHNNGDLSFSDVSTRAGMAVPSLSNGAAYADLDMDGDLDLVVNNLNQEAFVWKNETRQRVTDTVQNFLAVQLKGSAFNRDGLGSKVTLYNKATTQMLESAPVRGFSSCVDKTLHFGLGNHKRIDSVKIQWPDHSVQVLKDLTANQVLVVQQKDAHPALKMVENADFAGQLFKDITNSNGIEYTHTETQNFDFGFHQPLPQKYSQLGPCVATGDINGDGRTDFFVGGAANQPGKIFIQAANGSFEAANLQTGNKIEEDIEAIMFDADGDKDLDLLITGGSFEFSVPKYNQPRLYLNDGRGNFLPAVDALPEITEITKALAVADYDGDGDLDVFIGGRLSPKQYPQSPRSYLLQNNKGKFTDVTKEIAPSLVNAGMITAAVFTDFDNDQQTDLVICGEWTPIRFFKNINHTLGEVTAATGLTAMNGLWRSLQQADIDKDGDMDYIAGNTGLNNRYHVKPGQPMMLYAKDIDQNGFSELIPAHYIKNKAGNYQLYPALDRNRLAEQLPAVKKKYLLHQTYSTVTMDQLLNDFGKEDWTRLTCETTASVWLENRGGGKFIAHALPLQSQFAPINSIVAADMDGDGLLDILVAGNEYQAEASSGRYDASYGLLLKGNGRGGLTPVNTGKSGFILDGDVKDMKLIGVKDQQLLLAVPNDSRLRVFSIASTSKN